MDASKLTLTIPQFSQHLAAMIKEAQKAPDIKPGTLLHPRMTLACNEGVAQHQQHLDKGSSVSIEALNSQLKKVILEADSFRKQLSSAETKTESLKGAFEEL